jgi:hypothetical protein
MGKKLGNDYRLWIESAVAGTYNEVKGNTAITVNRQGGLFDTSSKDDGAYATQGPGLKAVSLSVTTRPNLPDANGYTRLETIALTSPAPATNYQVRKGGSAGVTGDTVFQASMYVANLNTSYPLNGVLEASFELGLAAAPTIDALA